MAGGGVDGRAGEAALVLDDTRHRLDPRVRVVWALGSALFVLVVGAAAIVATAVLAGGVWVGVAVAATVALLVTLVVWAQLSWRCFTWVAYPDALEVRHGVVRIHESLVPYHRIQQIDVVRGPVERLVGLSTLVLRTAAATTDARLPGIAAGKAESLRHRLLHRAGLDDAV